MIDTPGEGRPRLDEDGLLRVGDRWVAIPDAQLAVVALLVDGFGRVIRREQIAAAYIEAGRSGHDTSIRSLISRVSERVSRVGLRLHTVRGRGVMLVSEGSSIGLGEDRRADRLTAHAPSS